MKRRIVKTYSYTSADGVVFYEKVRYEPKGFSIRRPNGKAYLPGMGEQEPVLYNLQGINISPLSDPCFVSEGEKACDRLAGLNLLATTVAANWARVDVKPLRGRDCFIIRDDDQNGEDQNANKKAFAAADALIGVAKSVRIVNLPDLPLGGDVFDWLDRNDDDVAMLRRLCEEAPLYQPAQQLIGEETELLWDRMSDIDPEPIDWIWPGRIARGKLTLVCGDPGIGKSQIALDIAARITNGGEFPDGSPAPAGSVLILTAEDAAKDTVRPRFEAAGADLTRVHRLKAVLIKNVGGLRTFSLQQDLDGLSIKMNALGDVVMIIIDPITSYMGEKIDSHHVTAVRAVLEPLASWAEQFHVAVLGVTHPPKSAPAKAIHAVVGSISFVAAARVVFLATKEPETDRCLLLPVKNNLGPPAPGLGYSLVQTIISKGIVASHVVWDSMPVNVTADEVLAVKAGHRTTEAKDFLRDELAEGPRRAQDIKKAAHAAGLSWATIRRAQERLGIKPRKTGFDGGWQWQIPEEGGS